MERDWECPICCNWMIAVFDTVRDLAEHVQLWHDEWLTTNQLPPHIH